jgi:Arc/MetJ family transcription regulator
MRTNIDIDEKLMKAAMKAAGTKTKRETVAAGLEALVERTARPKMLDLFGKLDWEGYPIDDLRRSPPAADDDSAFTGKQRRAAATARRNPSRARPVR